MRCVHCGKPLGRFRKTTGEFCSEEHRNEYRDQIERAALERLLISRQKLTSNQRDPVASTIAAELIQLALSPLKAAGMHAEVWPIPASSASLFPSSGGAIEPGLRAALLPSMPHCLLGVKSRPDGPGGAFAMEAPDAKVLLPANGIRPNSLGLRSAVDQLPLGRTMPGAAGWQPITCEIEVEPQPFTTTPLHDSRGPVQTRALASGGQPIARSVELALQPRQPRSILLADTVIRLRNPPEPLIGTAGLMLRTVEFDLCKLITMQMAARRNNVPTAGLEPIAWPCDAFRPCRLEAGARTSRRPPVAPVVSISFAVMLPAGRTEPCLVGQFPNPAAMLLLPGTRTIRSTDAESGIPDRQDDLKRLAAPVPFATDKAIAGQPPALFELRPLPSFPAMPVWTTVAALPLWTGLRSLGQSDAVLLPAAVSRQDALSTCEIPPPALLRAGLQPFERVLRAGTRLIPLSLPEAASGTDTLKKTSVPADGNHRTANTGPTYTRTRLQLQPGWNAARSRLVRVYAAVPALKGAVEVRGETEPAAASGWQTPVIPRARLFPAFVQEEERTSIEAPGAANTSGRFAGIGPLLRFWESSHRGVKGAVIVFSCMLAFGLYSTVSNPQPVSATARDAESAAITGPLRILQESVMRRAGVHLADDFRTGLHAWEGSEDWSDSWSYDQAGFVHPGRLALFTPSLKMTDYRLEFVGQIHKKGLGWAVRAADVMNYMAVKLVHVKTGPIPRLAIVRYAVLKGKEERHTQVSFPFEARTDTVYNIRMEVRGGRFSLFIQDRIADSWEEDRLESGGVGFFSTKGEDARLRWLRLTYQYDWVGRICAALAG